MKFNPYILGKNMYVNSGKSERNEPKVRIKLHKLAS